MTLFFLFVAFFISYALISALSLMMYANKKSKRTLWLIGAVLVGFVVTKLFFIELGSIGSFERIVSFMGVGVLLLVTGYFAPLPPKNQNI